MARPMSTQNAPNESRSFASSVAVALASGAFILAMIAVIVLATGGGGSSSSSSAKSEPVHVTLTEFKINPAAITAAVGGKLHIQNSGSMTHNFEVKGTNLKTPDIAAGGSAELDLGTLKAGSYDVDCLIPGHADSGMKGKLTIAEGAAAGVETASGGASHSQSSGSSGSSSSSDNHDWAAMDKAMADGMATYLKSLDPGAAPLTQGQGNQKLQPTIAADGTKEFTLEASIIDWQVEPGKTVKAWAYNNQVPGPWIRVEPNDKVRIKYVNKTPAGSDVHWHGIGTPNDQDGVATLTQPMVKSGETYTYEFQVPNHTELGMYHPHNHGEIAIPNGMFGIFQVGDVPLPSGKVVNGKQLGLLKADQEVPMVLNDAGVIGLSLNGKAFPATGATIVKPGETALIHYYNEGLLSHPMHLHGVPQLVVAKDGFPLDTPYYADTINVAPGERYSVLAMPTTNEIGAWAWHCHILNHAESDKGLTGMVTAFVVPDPNKK